MIQRCTVTNIMKIKRAVVEFDPDNGALTVITGKNGSGKTSFFHALRMGLGGKRFVPQEPVRRGADKGEVAIVDDKYLIKLVVYPDRTTETTVTSIDGEKKYGKPQTLLGEFYRDIGFDVGQFCDMTPAQRIETLRELLGLDWSGLDAKRKAAYDERTIVNRKVEDLKAQIAYLPEPPEGTPEHEVRVATLAESLREMNDRNNERAAAETRMQNDHARLAELQRDIDAVQQRVRVSVGLATDLGPTENTKAVELDIAHAEETNRLVRQRKDRLAKIAEQLKAQDEAAQHTGTIAKIDRDKRLMVEAAEMPIPGVEFGEDDITYNGLPFGNASHSDQLEISAAISAAINPSGLALIEHGEKFDSEHRKALARALHGKQAIMEVATDGEPCGIVFQDGEVKETVPA